MDTTLIIILVVLALPIVVVFSYLLIKEELHKRKMKYYRLVAWNTRFKDPNFTKTKSELKAELKVEERKRMKTRLSVVRNDYSK
ncbi:hypothetical protein B4U37_01725 [Sutcliffiella horikoshii]|uniref:Uncharacterized protein n=1 Tax=Sutcliffiella horikoshii TaxID=79883 RepID=A0ABN4ZCR2_9BACI|nr:hypothetical protein [Sutcliffiella horikoshii]ART74844.1 hypothetical protein B4U37_01725 [Sutcliffiella horikoshii]